MDNLSRRTRFDTDDYPMNYSDKTIFCTGGTGFIGKNLIDRLRTQGAKVVLLVPEDEPLSVGFDLSGLTVYVGRVEDDGIFEKIFSEQKIDFVVHLAATATVQEAAENPRKTFETNIRGTWNLLEALRRSPYSDRPPIRGLIHASTDKVYGEGVSRPYREDDPLHPRYLYDVSKASGDAIARTYHRQFGLPIMVARFCNVYGPQDFNWTRVVPGTIQALEKKRTPTINRYLNAEGRPTSFYRDFIFIDDILDALDLLIDALDRQEHVGEVFNFGTEKFHAIDEVVATICRIYEKSVEPNIRMVEAGEICSQSMSYAKAARQLGFKPKVSLEGGLVQTIEWYRREFFY